MIAVESGVLNENLYEREVCRFRPYRIFGRHSLPTMPVGHTQNTAGQRNPFVNQACGAARDELSAPSLLAYIFIPQIRVVAYEIPHHLNACGILHDC